MITIQKDSSLLLAEAVLQMLFFLAGDDASKNDVHLRVYSTHIGSQSALRIVDENRGRIAWIFSRVNSKGIRVLLGDRARKGYDLDAVPKPNNDSEGYDFMAEETFQAAETILKFFNRPGVFHRPFISLNNC